MLSPSIIDRDHQIEKLEFALAISKTKGDKGKSEHIISQIKRLGK